MTKENKQGMLSLREIRAEKRKREKETTKQINKDCISLPSTVELKKRMWSRTIGGLYTNNMRLNRPNYEYVYYTSLPISSLVARGLNNHQRVGKMINLHRLDINIGVEYLLYNPQTNVDPKEWAEFRVPSDLKVWLIRKKQSQALTNMDPTVVFHDREAYLYHPRYDGLWQADQAGGAHPTPILLPGLQFSKISNTFLSMEDPNVELIKSWIIKPPARGYVSNLQATVNLDLIIQYEDIRGPYTKHASYTAPPAVNNNQTDEAVLNPQAVLSCYFDNEPTTDPLDVKTNDLWLCYTTDMLNAANDPNHPGPFNLSTSVLMYYSDV